MISIRNLSYSYKTQKSECNALENINLEIEKSEICTVIGPSGCGKSTLLGILAGIHLTYQGDVSIESKPVDPKGLAIGMVFQNYGLLPWKTVHENILLGLKIRKAIDVSHVDEIIDSLQLRPMLQKYPKELSGGEKQRVAVARAFSLKPDILLMDEPFSALDALTREEIQQLFLDLWRRHSVTTVFVTHSVQEALYLGQQVVVMSPSPGRILNTSENHVFGFHETRYPEMVIPAATHLREIMTKGWSR